MPFIASRPAFAITPAVREKLLSISPATIDRALEKDRAALALKECTDLVEQKLKMDRAVDSLLVCAHDVPVLPRRGTDRHG
jgi:hypothetical protein